MQTWLVYLQKSTNRYMTYIITYSLSGARAFNAAWIALHTLWERIHALRKRPQDIPRSPHSRCVVVASRTIDTQPLSHDRDCPQANLVLRGRVWDSHHSVGENLPSYLVIGALLQNSKLHKINAKSKSYLDCIKKLTFLPKTDAPWGLESVILIRYGEPPGTLVQGPESLPRVTERGKRGRQVVKPRLLTLIIG
jgi:hypothetical protein